MKLFVGLMLAIVLVQMTSADVSKPTVQRARDECLRQTDTDINLYKHIKDKGVVSDSRLEPFLGCLARKLSRILKDSNISTNEFVVRFRSNKPNLPGIPFAPNCESEIGDMDSFAKCIMDSM